MLEVVPYVEGVELEEGKELTGRTIGSVKSDVEEKGVEEDVTEGPMWHRGEALQRDPFRLCFP